MKSKYIALWMIMATALLIILLYSLSDIDPAIGPWHPKKAPFAQTLLKDKKAEQQQSLTRDSLLQAQRDSIKNTRITTDSLPQSILLIGDSMTLNLAYRLAKYAKHNHHRFHAVNWDSSNTRIWASCDTLSHFIRQDSATFVFISLGANELYLAHPESHRQYVEAILAQIGTLPYVWIGPPNWKEDAGLNDMIEATCRPGTFFRSAGMTFQRKRDGVHPTRPSSALWIDSIARWMPQSAHPILMQTPPDSLNKTNPNVTFLKARNK